MSKKELTPVDDPKFALVRGEITLELTKDGLNYQSILQAAENITFSEDTINQDYVPLKNVRELIKRIEDKRKEKKEPHKLAGDRIDDVAKSLSNPLKEVLDRKTKEYQDMVNRMREEAAKKKAEEDRVNTIKANMSNFIVDMSGVISQCTTDKELVEKEKLINLEVTRKNKYEEFLPEFINMVNILRTSIANQKTRIRELNNIDKEIDKADDATALELMDKKEALISEVRHYNAEVQEKALEAVPDIQSVETIAPSIPKARQTRWAAEIVDVELAFKKNRDMLDISLNAKKVAEELDKVKKEDREQVIGGIRYFRKEIF